MKRRDFLKTLAAGAFSLAMPPVVNLVDAALSKTVITSFENGWSVDSNGFIEYDGPGDKQFTVLELHRWLQDLADREPQMDRSLDITWNTPSFRITDSIIKLNEGYSIDPDAVKHLHGGALDTDDVAYTNIYSVGHLNRSTPLKIKINGNTVVETESLTDHFDLLLDTSNFQGKSIITTETNNNDFGIELDSDINRRALTYVIPIF